MTQNTYFVKKCKHNRTVDKLKTSVYVQCLVPLRVPGGRVFVFGAVR